MRFKFAIPDNWISVRKCRCQFAPRFTKGKAWAHLDIDVDNGLYDGRLGERIVQFIHIVVSRRPSDSFRGWMVPHNTQMSSRGDLEHLHHLIPQMVDHLDGDPP